jgi:hypothetical protein
VADDADVEGAGGEFGGLFGGGEFPQVEVSSWGAVAEGDEEGADGGGAEAGWDGGAEGAGLAAADAGDGGGEPVGGGEEVFGLGEDEAAGGGEGGAAAGAVEEPDAEFAFEALDALGEGGLGHVQAFGGASEVFFLGDGPEVPQMQQQVHDRQG